MSKSEGNKKIKYHNEDVYEGEIDKEGRPHGQGTYTHHKEPGQIQPGQIQPGQIQPGQYVGEWKDGEKHGKGTHCYRNGDAYVGPWLNGKRHGPAGKYTYYNKESIEYTGNWEDDMKHGQGVMVFANGDKYKGEWQNNNMGVNDDDTYTYTGGSTYAGKCSVSLDVSK